MKPVPRLIHRYQLTAGKAPLNLGLVRSLYISRLAALQEQCVALKRRRLGGRLAQSAISHVQARQVEAPLIRAILSGALEAHQQITHHPRIVDHLAQQRLGFRSCLTPLGCHLLQGVQDHLVMLGISDGCHIGHHKPFYSRGLSQRQLHRYLATQ